MQLWTKELVQSKFELGCLIKVIYGNGFVSQGIFIDVDEDTLTVAIDRAGGVVEYCYILIGDIITISKIVYIKKEVKYENKKE